MRIASRRLTPAAVLVALAGLGCPPADTKYHEVESRRGSAVAAEAHPGADFNKFFPKDQDGHSVVFDQEKKGASLASLKKGGMKLADMSITDTVSTPDTVKEFDGATDKLDGKYPLRAEGKKGTAILVAGRYQVKIRNDGEAEFQLSEDARKEWIKKFDLDGLSQLK